MQRLTNQNATMELGYWAIRGLGQPIRSLLWFVGVPFSEIRYGVNQDGSPVDDELADWHGRKYELGLAFPNIPYLIDSSDASPVCLTQSNAILRYLARKFDLYGDTEQEQASIDVLQDVLYDFRNTIIRTTYVTKYDYPGALEAFASNDVPKYLGDFERHMRSVPDPVYFVGSRTSFIDFIAYELIWQTSLMLPDSVSSSSYPQLHKFLNAFATLPGVSSYMADPSYIQHPINSEGAAFK